MALMFSAFFCTFGQFKYTLYQYVGIWTVCLLDVKMKMNKTCAYAVMHCVLRKVLKYWLKNYTKKEEDRIIVF